MAVYTSGKPRERLFSNAPEASQLVFSVVTSKWRASFLNYLWDSGTLIVCSCLQDPSLWGGYCPKNGKLIFTQDWMKRADAYEKGIEKIMQDPHHNICRITYWLFQGYSLECWRVSDDDPIVFEKRFGKYRLFFSELLFKWKDLVPRRG